MVKPLFVRMEPFITIHILYSLNSTIHCWINLVRKGKHNIANPTQIDEAEWNSAYDEYTLSKINDTRFGY